MQLSYGNKKILQIAIPSIVSNITVPLLGLIDVTIVGHLGSAAYIGAIAVGGMLFNIIYWIFGFLRMGTSGMTSQAYGRHDLNEVTRLLLRSVGVGLFIALILLALQYPIEKVAFTLIDTTDEVAQLSALYFRICIWGAPAVLGLYSFAGWFIGMQNSRFPMYIAITQNIVNIVASLCLVYGFNMKIEGVAIGTLTAQYAGLVMAYLLWIRYYGNLRKRIEWHSFFDRQAMYRFFKVNRDIFFRTICLVAVTVFFTSAGAAQGEVVLAVNTLLMQLFTLFSYIMDGFAYAGEALAGVAIGTLTAQYAGLVMAYLLWIRYYGNLRKRIEWHSFFDRQAMYRFFKVNRDIFFRTICLVAVTVFFTSAGAAQGEVVLAVNTLLMQLFTLFSYIMDGFAYAGEALAGKYIGAGNRRELHQTVRRLFGWGIGLSLAFTLLYGAGGQAFLRLLTDDEIVITTAGSYFYWVLAIPLAGFSAFLLDGIFIGATATHLMLRAMIVASGCFFLIYYGFKGTMENHALWMAFITYLLLRGVLQGVLGRKILGYYPFRQKQPAK